MARRPESGCIPHEIRCVTASGFSLLLFLPLLFHLIQVLGWSRGLRGAFQPIPDGQGESPKESDARITVVLPVRNEQDTLPHLLNDLSAGGVLPAEVIVIDDASEDGTIEAVQTPDRWPFPARIMANPGQGKKAGLSAGIRASRTEWVVQVDGDVRVGPEFIAALMRHLQQHADGEDLVLLPLRLAREWAHAPQRTFELLQALDFAAMQGWAVAAVRKGRPAMASGGAWMWRASAFPHDRLRPEIASGDDVFSLAALIERGDAHRVGWCGDPAAMASAAPMPTPGRLLDQRIRWGGKSTSYPKALGEARRVATVIAAVHFAGVALLAVDPPLGLLFWTTKGGIDMAYAHQTGQAYGLLTGKGAAARWGPLMLLALVHPPFIITTLFLMPFRKAVWKGRSAP